MKTKIRRGWYVCRGYHIVEIEQYGNDKVLDWIVVGNPTEAYRLFHGNEITTYIGVFNRLKDAVEWAERSPVLSQIDDKTIAEQTRADSYA